MGVLPASPAIDKGSTSSRAPAGGAWLIEPTDPAAVLVPEDFDDELRAMGQAMDEFVQGEVIPRARDMERPEGKRDALAIELLRKSAEVGLCMIDIPEAYGGLDLGIAAGMLASEKVCAEGNFGVTWSAHVGIGTLPILFFGTPAQKAKYLPKSATAEHIHAYCLSESGSGSDALGARTRAVLNEAGTHYVLNGTKFWITNSAWADVYIVFAKVDGEHFTAFIVERGFPGLTPGPEEHKLGLRGSSTAAVNLEDCAVPVDNVLGEVGKGHKIAFHILNVGRFKLGAGVLGAIKFNLNDALAYGLQREQFKRPIASFGAIREKLADMAAQCWTNESLTWRLAGCMDAAIEAIAKDDPDRVAKKRGVIGEYGIESSISKVYGTEVGDFVIDQNLQIHGGAGFVEDEIVEKYYRDARVNLIFEGTNEINRLLIPGLFLKRAMKGKLALMPASAALLKRLDGADGSAAPPATDDVLAATRAATVQLKELALLGYSAATQRYMMALSKEQEVLLRLADLSIQTYAAESGYVRAQALVTRGILAADSAQVACAVLTTSQAVDKARAWVREIILGAFTGDKRALWLRRLAVLDTPYDVDRIGLRRRVADTLTDAGRWTLSNY